jgi:hypothetical protein
LEKKKTSTERILEWAKKNGVKVVEGKREGVTIVYRPKPKPKEKKK